MTGNIVFPKGKKPQKEKNVRIQKLYYLHKLNFSFCAYQTRGLFHIKKSSINYP